jgi:hypothetical protein
MGLHCCGFKLAQHVSRLGMTARYSTWTGCCAAKFKAAR